MKHCLYCYSPLEKHETDFHGSCVKKFFGTTDLPEFPYSEADLLEMAEEFIRSQKAVTGVQPKISLEIERPKREIPKLAIVGLWGDFILKLPNDEYAYMPETESLTMRLGETYGLDVVPFSLFRLQSGKLAYLTKRIDRTKNGKLHMEDMCQLTERLTEDKYKGSYEQIGRVIRSSCANPGNDAITFFEVVLFSFLTGNSDMHLKNFSLISADAKAYQLTGAYDLISSKLLLPDDMEEMALTINARKNKITLRDFDALGASLKIPVKVKETLYKKFSNIWPRWENVMDMSFLPAELLSDYKALILVNLKKLGFIENQK
jgi:serine/threonine-protein kinase HipA